VDEGICLLLLKLLLLHYFDFKYFIRRGALKNILKKIEQIQGSDLIIILALINE
jgi:hypothetical protein